jgi:AhpD family alkylhydroperoxidase
LSAKSREQIVLAFGQANECNYCVSAHSALGKIAGLTPRADP